MIPMIRRLITRIFGSDEVEQHYRVDSMSTGMTHWEHYYPDTESPVAPAETPARERPQQPQRKQALLGN